MSGIHTPWTTDGEDADWDMPTKAGVAVCGAAPFYDSTGELIGYAVNVGWNDKDSERRDLIVTAVNSYVSSQAEIERLRAAHLSIGELPSGMVSKIISEIVSWGDQCAGGSGREIIPSGQNEGKPYGHTYYEAAAALGALFEDARAALSGSKEQ